MSCCCLLLAASSATAWEAAAVPVTQATPERFHLLVIVLWHRAATFVYTATGPIQSLLCDLAAGRAESCNKC